GPAAPPGAPAGARLAARGAHVPAAALVDRVRGRGARGRLGGLRRGAHEDPEDHRLVMRLGTRTPPPGAQSGARSRRAPRFPLAAVALLTALAAGPPATALAQQDSLEAAKRQELEALSRQAQEKRAQAGALR